MVHPRLAYKAMAPAARHTKSAECALTTRPLFFFRFSHAVPFPVEKKRWHRQCRGHAERSRWLMATLALCGDTEPMKTVFRIYLLCCYDIAAFLPATLPGRAGHLILGSMTMNLKQLECFVRVVELGSFYQGGGGAGHFAAGAEPAGAPIGDRTEEASAVSQRTRVTPSESGKRLVAHGKGILHQVELAKQALEDEEASPVGKVIVGIPPSVGKLMTVPLVSRFRDLYSNASIGIVEGLTASMHEWLLLAASIWRCSTTRRRIRSWSTSAYGRKTSI